MGFRGVVVKPKKALINRALRTSLDLRGLVFGGGGGNCSGQLIPDSKIVRFSAFAVTFPTTFSVVVITAG